MNIFNEYAEFYDLLYFDKNYASECEYIENLFNKFNFSPNFLLDYGCGTGKHSIEFSKRGYKMVGVDTSRDMIQIANFNSLNVSPNAKLNCRFELAENFRKTNNIFDACISLFHVANYQTNNEDLHEFFEILNDNTKKGGLIIFDYWFTPAVEFLKPEIRFKEIENENLKISRVSIPLFNKNTIEIDFRIFIEDKKTNLIKKIEEKHIMMPLNIEIIQSVLPNDLVILDTYEWMTYNTPTKQSWSAVSILKKI